MAFARHCFDAFTKTCIPNYYVAMQLENKMCKRQSMSFDTTDNFIIKAPKSFNKNKYGKAVNALHGKPKFW